MSTPFTFKDQFIHRHIGPGSSDTSVMLEAIGASSLEQLIAETIPVSIRLQSPINLPEGLTEQAFLKYIRKVASKNKVYRSYIGMGYYNCLVPGVIQRNILENPGWYTQYTPYQAEIAQGRLEALLNYQTLICDLTGMELANASLLDEGTAAAEAMTLMFNIRSKEKVQADSRVLFVSDEVHPQTLDVLKTRAIPFDIELQIGNALQDTLSDQVFGVILQYPGTSGEVPDYTSFVAACKEKGILTAMATDLLALTCLKSPGEIGADVVFGSAQRFGVPMGYGGPHAAFFATHEEHKRHIPGRLIGISVDAKGNRALRMALQTREQHIKRDKATSNICTAQVLLAIMSSMYAVYHGPKGLEAIGKRVNNMTTALATALTKCGYTVVNQHWFDTLKVALPAGISAETVKNASEAREMNFRYFDANTIGISLDESVTYEDLLDLAGLFADLSGKPLPEISEPSTASFPASLNRTSTYLNQGVFNAHHSEHEMLRYIKSLENKDLSLNTSMIALGSCTMKLNATTEMVPVTWAEFGNIHPFAPLDQAEGYRIMFEELEAYLCACTGFYATSLQPNSGAQGEYAGLMVIREYLRQTGQGHRNVCLIPSSAHGTNPASAIMAGMIVVVVGCDEKGNIDLDDLKIKADQHAANLAALMVTYPSTHGVFETEIRAICEMIHTHGGQVYMDGANMNAQVGLTSPYNIGADVCHLNLHKTFCIPHGGGGPGMGPICVREHLAPYLPGHCVVPMGKPSSMTAVSAAPWGSASILIIPYAYIKMMGGEGLKQATSYAILNANYIKARLEEHYPLLYTGVQGRVAHEMILDMRGFKKFDVEVEDIAKRLMDYGFHAPTVSFPVPGTLMIEPTESEPKGELDRFCEAMIRIRKEIQDIADGKADAKDNVLKNAPHTASEVCAETWSHTYSRTEAAFPAPWVSANKFWPSVSRINNTYGDRNLVCVCPPMEAYANEVIS